MALSPMQGERSRRTAFIVSDQSREVAAQVAERVFSVSDDEALKHAWSSAQEIIFISALGVAVRKIAPYLRSKHSDPPVVCIDETYKYAIAVSGGHHGGNQLVKSLALSLGVEPIITTTSDLLAIPALDQLKGFVAKGDTKALQVQLNQNKKISLANPINWPVPSVLQGTLGLDGPVLFLSDRLDDQPRLVPPSLVLGVGCSSNCSEEELAQLITGAFESAQLDQDAIACLATISTRATHPAVVATGLPVVAYDPLELGGVDVPTPSEVVKSAVGTPSVAEAAALLGAGRNAELILTKQKSPSATVAIARRAKPVGRLAIVGIGPGSPLHRTRQAELLISNAEVVMGFSGYLELCRDLLDASQVVKSYPIGAEQERVSNSIESALAGSNVVLVASGDPGIYALATLVLQSLDELGQYASDLELEITPGVTAALAAASLAGAPLAHDHAYVSLSDLLTPWPTIELRLRALADTGMAVALYNPRSKERNWQLDRTLEIFSSARPPSTPVLIARRVSRSGESTIVLSLDKVSSSDVDMETLVIVTSPDTRSIGNWIYTPRGYGVSKEMR